MTFLRLPYYGDSERNVRVFGAITAWGKTPEARIPAGIWAKSYNVGGVVVLSSLLQKWNLDRWYAGRKEHFLSPY